jgi:hypothetical protein
MEFDVVPAGKLVFPDLRQYSGERHVRFFKATVL